MILMSFKKIFCVLQGILLGSILFPLRITLAALLFFVMWPLARLQLAGLSAEERSRPVEGWRHWLFHPVIRLLSRAVFLSLGFLWVRVKGRRADLQEAPVLVVAPHSGFLDMLVLCPAQLATVVSRSENTTLPVIGGERHRPRSLHRRLECQTSHLSVLFGQKQTVPSSESLNSPLRLFHKLKFSHNNDYMLRRLFVNNKACELIVCSVTHYAEGRRGRLTACFRR